MNAPYILYYLFSLNRFLPPSPHPLRMCFFSWLLIRSLKMTASSDSLLSSTASLPFMLYISKWDPLNKIDSLKGIALSSFSPSWLSLLKAVSTPSGPFHFPPSFYTPGVRIAPSLSHSQPITWILFCASQEPPNYSLLLDDPAGVIFTFKTLHYKLFLVYQIKFGLRAFQCSGADCLSKPLCFYIHCRFLSHWSPTPHSQVSCF